jgi:ABC-2 type transport system ATP-binding protein
VDDVLMDEDLVEVKAADINALAAALKQFGSDIIINNEAGTVLLKLPKGNARPEEINSYCFSHGIVLSHLLLKKKRLEARFFELTNN